MTGWLIIVSRSGSPTLREARGDSEAMQAHLLQTTGSADVPKANEADPRIATWQARLDGIDWLYELVRDGRAALTSHQGYPEAYLIRCRDFTTLLDGGLPHESPVWGAGPRDVLSDKWLGRTTVNAELLEQCEPEEWLLAEAWDES